MKRLTRGDAARIPYTAQLHLVAATYGQAPDAVEEWPADRFNEALALLELTGRR